MKLKFTILFILAFLLDYPQSFQYKKVNQQISVKTQITSSERAAIKKENFANAKSLTLYLPQNFDKSGNTDYTEFLQKGINENTDIIFPDFKVLVAPKGLFLKSNTNVLFLQNSKIKVMPNGKEFYAALNFEKVENINLYFANLEGERFAHKNNSGEWGMGIYMVHSKNINIYKPTITKFWGDGIYIGKLEGITSENILIEGAYIDENRRNGISIIAGKNINIKNTLISNTNGASPQYGIDIEPNKAEDDLQNICISNTTTFNNKEGGLLFALDNLQGNSNRKIDINISDYDDYYSPKGIEFHIDRGYQKYVRPISGVINIRNVNLYHNKIPLINNDSQRADIKLNLQNIKSDNTKLGTRKLNLFLEKFNDGKMQITQ